MANGTAADIRKSLLKWINTFPGVQVPGTDLAVLADGVVLSKLMHDMYAAPRGGTPRGRRRRRLLTAIRALLGGSCPPAIRPRPRRRRTRATAIGWPATTCSKGAARFRRARLKCAVRSPLVAGRLLPLELCRLLRDIKRFYETDLHEVIDAAKLPNLMAIAKEAAVPEIEKLVLLLLACSVQCEKKEIFVGRLMGLDSETQGVLMLLITQVRRRLPRAHCIDGFRNNPLTGVRAPSGAAAHGRASWAATLPRRSSRRRRRRPPRSPPPSR